MTLAIIQRLDLGGIPSAPVFASDERLFYRTSNTDLRKASLIALSDVLHSNGLNIGTGSTGYKIAQQIGNYYVGAHSHNGGFGAGPKCNFVELDSGATIQLQLPDSGAAQTGGGTQGNISDRVCFYYTGGGIPKAVWSRIPPNHLSVIVVSSIAGGYGILEKSPEFYPNNLLTLGSTAAGFNTLQRANWSTPGINAVLTTLKLPTTQGAWTDIQYPENTRIPFYGFIDGGFFYQFCKAKVAGNYTFGISRVSISGGNGVFYNIHNNGTDVQNMSGYSYAYYHAGTRYLAFTSPCDGMRVYLVNMAKFSATVPFPWSISESITVDNWIVNNNVTGLYIKPPYIYVSKGAGALYTAQFIKIFASVLTQPSMTYLGSKPRMRSF